MVGGKEWMDGVVGRDRLREVMDGGKKGMNAWDGELIHSKFHSCS